MAKRKTEDELKSTISKQNGELQRLRRQLQEREEVKDDAVAGQDAVQRELDRTRMKGAHEIALRKSLDNEEFMKGQIHEQRASLLTSIETKELYSFNVLQQKRRLVFELALNTGKIPLMQLALDL